MRCSFCKIDVPLPCDDGKSATICLNYQRVGVSSGKNCACPHDTLMCNLPNCPRAVTIEPSYVDPGPISDETLKAAYDDMQADTLRYNTLRQRREEGR